MSNNHNPIARIVEKLQESWYETTKQQPDYKVIRWMINPDDADIINGFYQLESSSYGTLQEFFVVLFTPFTRFKEYSRQVIHDWIDMWEKDEYVAKAGVQWDTESFKRRLETKENAEKILAEFLTGFQQKFCKPKQPLALTLIPRTIADLNHFNIWLMDLLELLPPEVKVSLVDHKKQNYFKQTFKYFKKDALTLTPDDMNLHQIFRQMATSGNSNDPEVGFRNCMYEMADGVTSKSASHVKNWGEKAIAIGLRSGLPDFLATCYLVYAGFLMQLKKDETNDLLDKGIEIAEKSYKDGNKSSANILIQLYGFKSAWHRIKWEKTKASQWLFKQAQLSVENKMGVYAISICKICAQTIKSTLDSTLFYESLQLGYEASEGLEYEELRISEIGTIAYHYIRELRKEGMIERADSIDQRMKEILGKEWIENVAKLNDKSGQSIPDISETIQSLNTNV